MSADFDVPADGGSGRAWSHEPAGYQGTARVRGLAVQRSKTRKGVIALVWNTYDGPPTSDAELGKHLCDLGIGAGLRAMPHLGVGGPALRPVSVPGVADAPEVAWDQLAEALGQPLPYWPIPLQQRQLIDAWQPGRPTVQALAVDPEMDSDVLLRLAALERQRSRGRASTRPALPDRDLARSAGCYPDDRHGRKHDVRRHGGNRGPTDTGAPSPSR